MADKARVPVPIATLLLALVLLVAATSGCRQQAPLKPSLGETPAGPSPKMAATDVAEPSQATEPSPTLKPESGAGDALRNGRHFAFVMAVSDDGGIVADLAEYLTGKDAEKAAASAGDESPPPNDYYISNPDASTRILRLSDSAKVRLVSTAEGPMVDGYDVPLESWIGAMKAGAESYPRAAGAPYWITIKNGAVTRIEEQYLP